MRLSGTNATNWLNDIKQYGRQFNDILEIYNDGSGEYISSQAIGTFLQSDINRIEYSVDCNLLKTEMGKLVVDINKSSQLYSALIEGRYLRYKIEIVGNNTPVDYGYFLITKIEEQKDKKSVLVTCYDGLVKTMTDYKGFYDLTTDTTFIDDKNYYLYDVSDDKYVRYTGDRTGNPSSLNLYQMPFPIRIADYIYKIAQKFNMSVIAGGSANVNNYVTSEHYVDIDGKSLGYTYRDVLDQLAEAGGCRIEFYVNNNYRKYIVLRNVIHETSTTIDENYFDDKNVNIGKKVGPYNCLVLSRASDSDNIYYPAILPQDPCEFKISNNLILEQDNREDYLQALYNIINGLEFYENDFLTKGLCLFEAGDRYIANIDNTNYTCLMLHDQMVRTTGLKENTQTTEPKFSVTDFKYSSSTDRAEISSRNASIKVDKANASIEQIVEAVGDNGEVTSASIVQSINDSGSQIKLNADKIYINGVTFDNDQNMTINDGDINLIDTGSSSSSSSRITITSTDETKLAFITSAGFFCDITTENNGIISHQRASISPGGASIEYFDENGTLTRIANIYNSFIQVYKSENGVIQSTDLYEDGILSNNFNLNGTEFSLLDNNQNPKFTVITQTGDTIIDGRLIIPIDTSKGIFDGNYNQILRSGNSGTNIVLNATGGDLFLGYANTNNINLLNSKITMNSSGQITATGNINSLYRKQFTLTAKSSDDAPQYYLLATLPANSSGNYTSLSIDGHFGTFTQKANVSIIITNRDGIRVYGSYTGDPNAWSGFDFRLYTQGDNSVNVYLSRRTRYTSDVVLNLYGQQATLYNSTTPVATTGTLTKTYDGSGFPNLSHTRAGTGIVTRSGGATLVSSSWARYGNVCSVLISITATSNIGVGSNAFTGTINSSFIPKYKASGVTFNASSCLVGVIETNGNITIRVTGATFNNGNTADVSFTYVMN